MLVRRLLRDGFDVCVILRKTSNLKLLTEFLTKIKIIYFDESSELLETWFTVHNPIAVFHIASLFLVTHKPNQIPSLIESNIQLGTQLAEACIKNDCCFINTGTSWQSFENYDHNCVNLYAASKDAFEKILEYYSHVHRLRVVTLRLFDTYGPNDPRPKIIQLLVNLAKFGGELNLSPGYQRINLVHIADIVECYIMTFNWIIKQVHSTNVMFGVFDNCDYSLREIVSLIEVIISRKINVNFGSLPYRLREVMLPAKGYSSLPGWHPCVHLKDGITELLI